jgi:cell wall-associated NlpC family hydrolase
MVMASSSRHSRRTAAGCLAAAVAAAGLLAVSANPSSEGMPSFRLAGNPESLVRPVSPGPGPGKAALKAAATLVQARAAALARSRQQVTAVSRALARLQAQAELVTERYDMAVATEQQAAAAYQAAATRLAVARRTQAGSRSRVAGQAAADFEAQGALGPMAVMFGGTGGPSGYLNALGIEQVLASHRTDALATDSADSAVATVFSQQAAVLLTQKQADVEQVEALRLAARAAVDQQVAAVNAARSARGQAAALLAIARTNNARLEAEHRAAVLAARRAAAAARAARERAAELAAARAGSAGKGSGGSGGSGAGSPAWTTGAGASAAQGNTAADWALTQIGKPYQWGAVGPGSYDCSGLALDAWARAGIQLGHYTGWQWPAGPHIPIGQLRRGDLVFYATNTADPATIHHVGIFIGGGMMVDAPFTGADVRIDSIYQFAGLIGATRPAN